MCTNHQRYVFVFFCRGQEDKVSIRHTGEHPEPYKRQCITNFNKQITGRKGDLITLKFISLIQTELGCFRVRTVVFGGTNCVSQISFSTTEW